MACFEFQVESPSSELGWLVCLAVTGSSRYTDGVVEDRSSAASVAAAAGGLLEDVAFFDHFFGRLTRGGGKQSSSSDEGDGPDARILEEVRKTCETSQQDETQHSRGCSVRRKFSNFLFVCRCVLGDLRMIELCLSLL